MDAFADKFKRFRASKGYTLEELAAILGTTKQVLSRYENGQRVPKITVVAEYAAKLDIPLTQLLPDEGIKKEPAYMDGLTDEKNELMKRISRLDTPEVNAVSAVVDALLAKQKE